MSPSRHRQRQFHLLRRWRRRPRTPGGNRVTECATATYADPKQQAECDAINDLAPTGRPAHHGHRPPSRSHPGTGRGGEADPKQGIRRRLRASTTTITRPATYEEEICNEFKTPGEEVCQKVLTVSVTESSASCVTGTDVAAYLPGNRDIALRQDGPDWWYGPGALKIRCDSFDQSKLYIAAETLVKERARMGPRVCGPGVRPASICCPTRPSAPIAPIGRRSTATTAPVSGIISISGEAARPARPTAYWKSWWPPPRNWPTITPVHQARSPAGKPRPTAVRPTQDGCYTILVVVLPHYVGPATTTQMLCDDGGGATTAPWVG